MPSEAILTQPSRSLSATEPQRSQDTSHLERLAQLLDGFGAIDGFDVKLDRIGRPTTEERSGYLGRVAFGPTFFADVAGLHGGGKFRARIHNARGRYQTSFTFSLAGAAIAGPIVPLSSRQTNARIGTIRSRAQDHQHEIESVRWFTPQRLATRWDISVTSVCIIPRERLPYKEFGAGTELKRRRYHPDDVAAFEASGRVPGTTGTPASAPIGA